MESMLLHELDVEAILAGRRRAIRVPVLASNMECATRATSILDLSDAAVERREKCDVLLVPSDLSTIHRVRPTVKPGTAILVREPYHIQPDGSLIYKVGNPTAVRPKWWKSGVEMKNQHARLLLEVTEVRAERLQDATDEELRLEGYESWGPAARRWNRYWLRRGNGYNNNPWTWLYLIRFQLLKGNPCHENTV